ncbi:MAG TPA: ABC transporter permease, partial [Chroococcidiopsis sp.]
MKPITTLVNRLLDSRFWALASKEVSQILRNKQLLFLLMFPPTIQLLLYGFVLNPDVQFIKLGVVDYAQSDVSRELVTAMTANDVFVTQRYLFDEAELGRQVKQGEITTGLVIPSEFEQQLKRGQPAEVQVLIDGVDANTAGIASGYLSQIVSQY